jgi:serine/threonine protein phosphatase PrpC
MGGFVNEEQGVMRVNGAVAVSRAFGNIRHRVITPDADVVIHELSGDEEYVVVACDGLWDVMTTEQVRKFVRNYMKKHGKRTKGISEALVNEALKLGSTDNVSVVFVEFEWWKEPKRN